MDRITEENGSVYFDPSAGSSVHDCLEACCAWARKNKRSITLRNFNGVDVVCSPRDSAAACCVYWEREQERKAEAYRNSPEGRMAASAAAERLRQCQENTTRLLQAVPTKMDRLVPWLAELSIHADHVGVQWDRAALLAQLKAMGYVGNAHVGKRRGWTRKSMAEYIVGQAIDCLERGMPPHPVTTKFAAEWAAMD